LKFYFSEIAGIKEPENIEDTIDPAVLGSAVHEALYNLYKPVIGNPLTIESLQVMEKNADGEVDKAFDKKFKGSDISFGKNLLLVRVAGLMVKRLLKYEADQLTQLAKSGEKMNIAFLEQLVETKISIRHNDSMLDIRIKGFIDRVDKMDGCWRIMDYKTGTTEAGHVKVKDWDDLITAPELNIGFQLLMYGYLLGKMFPSPMISCAGILSLKKLNAGFMAVSVPGDDPVKLTTTLNVSATNRFEQVIRTILSEIYDLGKPFTQTTDLNICLRCPYVNLCGR
jgi:hypothetical protein